ncbi:hypothetical protein SAMN05421510_101354 [Nitrosomonas ureae]|uniref:Uncharacterized protein n=2 Tax=Nitrosomonas ureae TaxID=44577 RepID=A0A1H9CA00_9PROT|nr:hypothetical protein SAMN05421510_101354 [Nitrosomonas ureae]
MKTWKTAPAWFNLDNYSFLAEFTAEQWINEIQIREYYWCALMQPHTFSPYAPTDAARNFFKGIKTNPLVSQEYSEDISLKSFFEFLSDGKYKQKFYSVQELTEYAAYSFFLESERKEEIDNDFKTMRDITDSERYWQNKELLQQKKNIGIKYSYPLTNIEDYRPNKFLEINLDASNELILEEFKDWLVHTRSTSNESIKRKFSSTDFEDWASSRLLPYWDLTTIATIEDSTIPFHVLGKMLFPDEYEIDLAERIRKITKKKCQYLFSHKVVSALNAQTSQHNLSKSE